MIASLHDPNLAVRFANTVVMLSEGRMMASGTVRSVMISRMVSRLYQTPTRRVETEDGETVFVPSPCAPLPVDADSAPWT